MSNSATSVLLRWMLVAFLPLIPESGVASVKVFEGEDRSLDLGLRLQPRAEYARVADAGGGTEGQSDFFIRRTRLRLMGRLQSVSFFAEWRFDGVDQIGVSPVAGVESAWITFPIGGGAEIRAGQYDQPFSRDRLTSYARQLAVDRGAVSNVPTVLGLADKAMGLELSGRVKDGRGQYALGVFDNRVISGQLQRLPMVVSRVDWNFASTADVFQDAHFGDGTWCSVGLNGSYQGSIENAAGAGDSSQAAAGIDGMFDVPVGAGRLLVRGELSGIRTQHTASGVENRLTQRMIGAGFLTLREKLQPFVRYDQVRGSMAGESPTDITHIGVNYYMRRHSLKLQGDLRCESGTEDLVDGVRMQAQIDF